MSSPCATSTLPSSRLPRATSVWSGPSPHSTPSARATTTPSRSSHSIGCTPRRRSRSFARASTSTRPPPLASRSKRSADSSTRSRTPVGSTRWGRRATTTPGSSTAASASARATSATSCSRRPTTSMTSSTACATSSWNAAAKSGARLVAPRYRFSTGVKQRWPKLTSSRNRFARRGTAARTDQIRHARSSPVALRAHRA